MINEQMYPKGLDLVMENKCPKGMNKPLACMFCMQGHLLECHYPKTCEQAQCSHLIKDHE